MPAIIFYCKEHWLAVTIVAILAVGTATLFCIALSLGKKAKKAKAQIHILEAERRREQERAETAERNCEISSAQRPSKQKAEKHAETLAPKPSVANTVSKKTDVSHTDGKPKTTTKTKNKTETQTEKKRKETNMLLDELKNADIEPDFYEEDETDRIARYSGKWVICRVVTDDKNASEEETYFFELHASNGEKLLSSEEYTSYAGALRGIETHKTNILRGNFRITLSKKGDYIFKLLSGKNLLLCMGEHYATRASCESAVESTKRFAKTAIVDENIQDHIVKVPPENDAEILPVTDGCNGKWILNREIGVDGAPVYSFELFANNGEKLLSSEEYTTYAGAINGIETHKSNIKQGNFRVSLTKRGDYIYKLLNRNGQLLCLGEHYKTKRRCLNAVESVKRFAAKSPVLTDPKVLEAAKAEQQNN